jgi:hypothetical protein
MNFSIYLQAIFILFITVRLQPTAKFQKKGGFSRNLLTINFKSDFPACCGIKAILKGLNRLFNSQKFNKFNNRIYG